jgi:hypothetical protein
MLMPTDKKIKAQSQSLLPVLKGSEGGQPENTEKV